MSKNTDRKAKTDQDEPTDRDKQTGSTRRGTLKALGAATAGSTLLADLVTGDVAAQSSTSSNGTKADREYFSNSQSMVITKDNALTMSEYSDRVREVREQYGDSAANMLPHPNEDGSVSIMATTPNGFRKNNVTLVHPWEQHYKVKNDVNQTVAQTDHFLNLYDTNMTDPNNREVKFYSMLSLSKVNSSAAYRARTTHMSNYLNIKGGLRVNSVNPTGTLDLSGNTGYQIGVSVGPKAVAASASISTTVGGGGGEIHPDGDRLTYGDNGEFAVEFGGSRDGTTSLPGAVDIRGSGYSHTWSTHVGGTTLDV